MCGNLSFFHVFSPVPFGVRISVLMSLAPAFFSTMGTKNIVFHPSFTCFLSLPHLVLSEIARVRGKKKENCSISLLIVTSYVEVGYSHLYLTLR